MTRINVPHMTATLRQQTEQARALDAATRLRRTFGGQVAANLRHLEYGQQ
jgi:hypothetical protein